MKDNKPYNLLAVLGATPQVLTETLYALHKQGKPMPQRIKIITTAFGKDQAWLRLGLGENGQQGKLFQFFDDYDLAHVPFEESDIWVVQDEGGTALDDVVSADAHKAMADFITDKVAQMTSDPNISLHASLAGGRKTMTFFLGYAMSLFGRFQDSLSHVLVTSDYESSRDFFYPSPVSKTVTKYDGTALDAKNAVVSLADIPFVRMREDIPERLLKNKAGYSDVIESLNKAQEPASLIINLEQQTLTCSDFEIRLDANHFMFYVMHAMRAKNNMPGLAQPNEMFVEDTDIGLDIDMAKEFLGLFQEIKGELAIDDRTLSTLENGVSKRWYSEKKSKVKKSLTEALGKRLTSVYEIQVVGLSDSGVKLYGINLLPEQIDVC